MSLTRTSPCAFSTPKHTSEKAKEVMPLSADSSVADVRALSADDVHDHLLLIWIQSYIQSKRVHIYAQSIAAICTCRYSSVVMVFSDRCLASRPCETQGRPMDLWSEHGLPHQWGAQHMSCWRLL